jgi:phosphoribosyl-AMP cyclohydrolase
VTDAAREGIIAVTMSKTASPPPAGDQAAIEESTAFTPRFDADGLVPVVVTSASSGEVLMFAYMNAEALARTIETGEAHYWSRSRGELWRKGETSGNTQRVVELRTDCDQDAHWPQDLLLSRRSPWTGFVGERLVAIRRRAKTIRSGRRLPSRSCRKGNLKDSEVVL